MSTTLCLNYIVYLLQHADYYMSTTLYLNSATLCLNYLVYLFVVACNL